MAGPNGRIVREERSKRQERAHRILDATAELVRRWGYKKTTIDDIAKQAGVAKGTIYLHWKTREDLFIALFLRESMDTSQEMLERMKNDPEGFLLHNVTKHSIYVVMKRPLMRALYVGDTEILGELVHSEQEIMVQLMRNKMLTSESLFELMRSKGMMRTDMSVRKQVYVYSAMVMGFMTVEAYLPEHYHLPTEEAVKALAETIKLTLEPEEPVSPATMQEVGAVFQQAVQQLLEIANEQLQKEME